MSDYDALAELQESSFSEADGALRSSWPRDHAMSAAELAEFLEARTYCVLATTTPRGRAQARPVGFAVFDGAFWIATVRGGRLRNVEATGWGSLVVIEGEGEAHRAAAVDGSVLVHEAPPPELLDAWERRHGSRAQWAAAWLELRPERVFSHRAESA